MQLGQFQSEAVLQNCGNCSYFDLKINPSSKILGKCEVLENFVATTLLRVQFQQSKIGTTSLEGLLLGKVPIFNY